MITLAGISHHTAPLAVRERLAVPADEVPALLQRANRQFGAASLVNTCNRLELYLTGEHDRSDVLGFLCQELHGAPEVVERAVQVRYGPDAVRHLYAVASGIDSMVLGETEILGQVRGAFSATVAAGADDAVLSRLFHTAIRTGRRARVETAIGRHALSVSSIAVQQARSLYPDLSVATVLVIGAGEAGRLAAESIVELGVREVLVANRTAERAQDLATQLGGVALPLSEVDEALARADVVIASTGSPEAIVGVPAVQAAAAQREGKPLLIVDIGVPRDFDPAVRDVENVTYCDLDDLQAIADRHSTLRGEEVGAVQLIVDAETERFFEWWAELQVVPTIAALTERAEALRRSELSKTLRRLRVDGDDRAHVEELLEGLTRALVKQVLHDPITTLRERGDRDIFLDTTRTLFRLNEPAGPREDQ